MDAYAQLCRSLLPRVRSFAVFDARGTMRWSSDEAAGAELEPLVRALADGGRAADSEGDLHMLPGNVPAYLFAMTQGGRRPLGFVALTCMANGEAETEARSVSFVHAILKPALECLRRDLISRLTVGKLKRAVVELEKVGKEGKDTDGGPAGGFDSLTGLYTRPAFEHRVRAVVSGTESAAGWCSLYINVDQLHVINDNFGMRIGDSVLGQLGELLRKRLPPGAFAARISGDRFAVLLPGHLDDAERFGESLREGAEELGKLHGNSRLRLSISIGVAVLDVEQGELMHSLAAAETACKAAKDRGRNRVEVYRSNDVSLVRRFADINVAAQLHDAISSGRLRLDAQLIQPFGRDTPLKPHYELLVRMLDEDGAAAGPETFMSAAMRYQLMPKIDRWVIDSALERLEAHAPTFSKAPLSIAINFSGQSLNDEGFEDFLIKRIAASGLPPELFCFELTEDASIANVARAGALMGKLRALGCGIALDDFGSGLSSLSYLRQLPVTMLKIDGSFVRDVVRDPRAESMVRAVAQLARSMSLATVAEYVETEEIRACVEALGVDYGQGFAISKPLPFDELLAELSASEKPARSAAAESAAVSADDAPP
jgi:diguanylate cyclase (GGDEF)-like protein